MTFITDAMAAAAQAPTIHDFAINNRVRIRGGDYRHELGSIQGFETNFLGIPLIVVLLDSGLETVFYANEVELHVAT